MKPIKWLDIHLDISFYTGFRAGQFVAFLERSCQILFMMIVGKSRHHVMA